MRNAREFFIPSICFNNAIHLNFNLMIFALVRRAPNGNTINYATVSKAIIKYFKYIL